jgi:hypothetical protein
MPGLDATILRSPCLASGRVHHRDDSELALP